MFPCYWALLFLIVQLIFFFILSQSSENIFLWKKLSSGKMSSLSALDKWVPSLN
nr:ATP synthase F0 subunit 8 [Goniodes ortygis]